MGSCCGSYLDSRPGASTWNSDMPNIKKHNFGCEYQQFFTRSKELLIERSKYEAIKNTRAKISNSSTTTVTTEYFNNQIQSETLFNRIQQCPSKKSYVQLVTSYTNINLELYCDIEPIICKNFLIFCETGQYDGTNLNILPKNVAIQVDTRKILYDSTVCVLNLTHANSFNKSPKNS